MKIRELRVVRYLEALYTFYRNGGNFVTKETLEARFAICKECEFFNGLKCEKCGCCAGNKETHFNKLAFPSESCPIDKWTKEEIRGGPDTSRTD